MAPMLIARSFNRNSELLVSASRMLLRPCARVRRSTYVTASVRDVQKSPLPALSIPDNISLPRYLCDTFAQYGDLVALEDGISGRKFSYSELQTAVAKVGSSLVKQGLRPGDVVTIFSPNCPEFAIMFLAVGIIGGVASAVNPVYTTDELARALGHSNSKLLVTSPIKIDVAKAAAAKSPTIKEIIVFGEAEGCRPFDCLLDSDMSHFPENLDIDPVNDLLALPYSSGTTGLPKGVMLSHYSVLANVEQLTTKHTLDYTPREETLVGVLPFFHIYGQVVVLLAGLKCGAKIITLPKFDPELYLRTIRCHMATFLNVVPPIVLFLAKHPLVSKYDLSSVQGLYTGAAPIGAEQISQALEQVNKQAVFKQGYGLTEMSPATHINPTEGIRYDTIGLAVHNTDYKVVDLESGESLGPKQEGELVVRGPQMMKGYYDDEKATRDTIKDGWLHTGDIGYYEEDGHVIISDRLKELIKVKGLQVAPAELEALLVTHPAIQDAAVIAIPDERAGELPRAYVVLNQGQSATEADVKRFIEGKLAPYKHLAGGVEFRSVIPKSASGKILRRELKADFLAINRQYDTVL